MIASPIVSAAWLRLRICLFATAALTEGHWASAMLSFGVYFRVKCSFSRCAFSLAYALTSSDTW